MSLIVFSKNKKERDSFPTPAAQGEKLQTFFYEIPCYIGKLATEIQERKTKPTLYKTTPPGIVLELFYKR